MFQLSHENKVLVKQMQFNKFIVNIQNVLFAKVRMCAWCWDIKFGIVC